MLWPRGMQEPGLFTEGRRSFLEKNVHRREKRRSQCFQKNGGYGLGLRTLLPCQKGPDWGPQDVYLPVIVQFSINNWCQSLLGDHSPPNYMPFVDYASLKLSWLLAMSSFSLGSLAISENIFNLPLAFVLFSVPLNLLMFLRVLPLVFFPTHSIFSS